MASGAAISKLAMGNLRSIHGGYDQRVAEGNMESDLLKATTRVRCYVSAVVVVRVCPEAIALNVHARCESVAIRLKG